MDITLGIMLPFLGTALGSAFVCFIKKQVNDAIQRSLLGFASGVMIAAGIWSLLLPALEIAEPRGTLSFLPATIGFIIGILILIGIDKLVKRLENLLTQGIEKGLKASKSTLLLTIAVTLHNVPEGMAVGVAFASVLAGSPYVTLASAMAISIGIAIQNIPEGAIISIPLASENQSKSKSFLMGTLSGVVEPVAAGITLLFTHYIEPLLPYLLAFASGAMYFVVANELLPQATHKEGSYVGVLGFTLGFLVMMILDVTLR